ncbi:MAG: hypothetical protein ACM30G_15050 [Micromonosporaceae bacterium]
MKALAPYAKALMAGLASGVVMYFSVRAGGVTAGEWETIVTTVLAASGITWAVPNAPEKP